VSAPRKPPTATRRGRGAAPSRARRRAPSARGQRVEARPGEAATAAPAPIAEAPPSLVVAPPPAEPAPEAEIAEISPAAPEPAFAARVPAPEPERPMPTVRRAIFFDVENSSRPEHVARVIEHLAVDRLGRATELLAVGNWKVIGHDTARLLARHGGHLVHSAPSVGVRDWSDLRIAVSAGVWLAAARPGDIVEIVSDDQAFDAVGDVAASLGIAFRRLSYRVLANLSADEVLEPEPAGEPRTGRRRRRGRWGRRPRPTERAPHAPPAIARPPAAAPPPAPAAPPVAPAAAPEGEPAVPHTAPHDEILAVVRDLMTTSPGGVSIDALANALKARGFRRTPGSPRLITRLRRIKEIDVNRAGQIALVEPGEPRLVTEPAELAASPREDMTGAPVVDEEAMGPEEIVTEPGPAPATARRRPRRRGGRRRRGRRSAAPAAAD
jgi:hypothetical protein